MSEFIKLADHVLFDLISVKFLCTLLREDTEIKARPEVQDFILAKMQAMKRPLVSSKPRFSTHMMIAMPYRSKSFFVITFHDHETIEFSVKEFPEIICEQINSLINYAICCFDNYIYLSGGTSYNSENQAFHSSQGFLYNILTDKWCTGPR